MKRSDPNFHKWLGKIGGLAAHKKLGKEFSQRLVVLSRKARTTPETTRLLKLWGLPPYGTIKKRKRKWGYEITWVFKRNNKLYYKYLGVGTEDKQPRFKPTPHH